MVTRVLCIGGIDPSGGAGLTVDARVLARHGAAALPVVSALTVQDRHGLQRVEPVAAELFDASLAAALADGPVQAIKVGLLAGATQVRQVAERLASVRAAQPGLPIVVDPVLSATAGGYRADGALVAAVRADLVPLATVTTPNLPESELLFAGDAGLRAAVTAQNTAVLQKGGHGAGARLTDRLVTATGELRWTHPRLAVGPVRGTGCALASALAAQLAARIELAPACERAITWLQGALGALARRGPGDGLPRLLPIEA
ncbi:MAG: hydroxymethylpyrimidine/phosphomethylpyrimidine kinase [Planctomycetota bacterium]